MKTLRQILKIIGYSIAAIILLAIIIAGFTQTKIFKDRLRATLASEISDRLNASFYLGAIRGNFVTGFTVDSLAIYSGTENFLRSGKLTVRYNLITISEKTLTIENIIVERPKIYFSRNKGSDWNIRKLFKPSKEAGKGEFDWTINLDDIELKNALVTLTDSETITGPDYKTLPARFVDYRNWAIRDLNLQMKANIKPDNYSAQVIHASFYSEQPQFELTHFTGTFSATNKEVIANNVIIQTSRSYLELDGRVQGVNIFRGLDLHSLRNDSTKLRFRAKNIDFAEFKSFLPPVDFLEGSALIDLDANGTFGALNIQRLNVQAYSTSLKLAGKLHNLHDPSNLYLDMFVGDSRLDPSDAAKLMPSFNLPKFSGVGAATFFAHYNGKPLDFKTTANVKGGFGNFEIDGMMNLQSKLPRYAVSFKTNSLNLQKITDKHDFITSISSKGDLAGEGISFNEITAKLKLDIDSARFRNLTVGSSNVQINAFPNKLEGTVALNAQEMKTSISSTIDFSNSDHPVFESQFSLTGFDLSRILDDQKYKTNLNLRGKLSGTGKELDNLNGNASITLLPSTIRQSTLSPEEIRFSLDQHDAEHKRLSLESSIADVEVTGKIDLDVAATALQQQAVNLVQAISKHVTLQDTLVKRDEKLQATMQQHTSSQRQLDFDYTINVKSLETISTIVEGSPFNTRGKIQGKVQGSDQWLSLSGNGSFEEFFIGTIREGILLRSAEISFDAKDLTMEHTLERLSGTVNMSVLSGISKMASFDSVHTRLRFENAENSFSFTGIIDSAYRVSFAGKSAAQPQAYAIDFDNLEVQAGASTWKNEDDLQLRLNSSGIRILHAIMKHDEEVTSLSGFISDTGQLDITVAIRKMSLNDLNSLIKGFKQQHRNIGFEGLVSSDLHLGGTTKAPVISFTATGENVVYRQSRMGVVRANIQYKNQLASIDINVQPTATDSLGGLIIKGTLPINLAFGDVNDRFPDQEQNLQIVSQNFDLGILEPLLIEFEKLTGKIVCNVNITGTPKNPQYTGSLSIRNSRFNFVPTNVSYIVNGDLEPSGDKIRLKNFVIKNVPEDRIDGEANLKGTISIKNFQVDNFDLQLYGQLLFMNDATKKIIPTMYGPLFAATDASGLTLKGTLERPFITGNLFSKDTYLVFPPTKISIANGSTLRLTYVVIDDTTKQGAPPPLFSKQFYTVTDTLTTVTEKEPTSNELSLIDRVRYDVNIETQGPTRIRMIFTPSTNEELYAELEGKVNAVNSTGTPYIYGEISIAQRSYYNFFKKFDATGSLKFVGQWDNPELDIKATYAGTTIIDTSEQKVVVDLTVTGTRYEPKLTMGLKVEDPQSKELDDWATKSGDVQGDAISFILTGKFRNKLTSKDREVIVSNVGTTASASATGFTTTFLSGMLTEFLQKEFSFIRSAEVSYGGGNLQGSADLRLSGEAFKGYWRAGGRIFNDLGNANINYQISLGELFNTTSIRNLFIELERKVEGSEFEERKLTNAARIYYRISF